MSRKNKKVFSSHFSKAAIQKLFALFTFIIFLFNQSIPAGFSVPVPEQDIHSNPAPIPVKEINEDETAGLSEVISSFSETTSQFLLNDGGLSATEDSEYPEKADPKSDSNHEEKIKGNEDEHVDESRKTQDEYDLPEYSFEDALHYFTPDYAAAVIVESLRAEDLKKLTELEIEVGVAVVEGKIVLFTSGNEQEIRLLPSAKELLSNASVMAHTHPEVLRSYAEGHGDDGPSDDDFAQATDQVEFVISPDGVYAYHQGGLAGPDLLSYEDLVQIIEQHHDKNASTKKVRDLLNGFIASIDKYNEEQEDSLLFRAAPPVAVAPDLTKTAADISRLAGIQQVVSFNKQTTDVTMTEDFFAYGTNFLGGVRVATGDVNGDGIPDYITGTGAGGGPHVKVFDGRNLNLIHSFFAFDPAFTGGVYVAAGDVNGDGRADIIIGAGAGGGPHVKVFDGRNLNLIHSFFAYNQAFTGGVHVAAGDINGDGRADIITGTGAGGGPHVKVFDGGNLNLVRSFFAYDPSFTGGVYVASGDVTGDGRADIVTGAGPGGGPHARVFNGTNNAVVANYFPYNSAFPGGVTVAVADVTGDGRGDIITGTGAGGGPHVKVIDVGTGGDFSSFFAYDAGFGGGIFVAAGDMNGDGRAEVITGKGATSGPRVRTFQLTSRSVSNVILNQLSTERFDLIYDVSQPASFVGSITTFDDFGTPAIESRNLSGIGNLTLGLRLASGSGSIKLEVEDATGAKKEVMLVGVDTAERFWVVNLNLFSGVDLTRVRNINLVVISENVSNKISTLEVRLGNHPLTTTLG
ncbi:MAG TPA: FG-GAP-like repeat-containing protein, partial [bacterium]|nr:FG-GAP-like repeat-containing protein [bacterium]